MRGVAHAMTHPLATDLDHVLEHTTGLWDSLRGSRIFITGGTGFVGTWLTESFCWASDKLHLDADATLLTRHPDAFRSREPWIVDHKYIHLLEGDASTFPFPSGQFDFLIHASTSNYAVPASEVLQAFDAEINSTRRVLEFARAARVSRMLFTSSGAVYGKQPTDLSAIPEDYPGGPSTTDPGGAYGHAKRISEFLCALYSRQYGFTATIARLFAFVGPRLPMNTGYAVGNFVRDAIAGEQVKILGDGTPYRSYLYSADLAVWLWTILLRGESARPYNVGSDNAISIADLARVVVEATGSHSMVEIARASVPGAAPARYVPSIERASKELGLRPAVSLAEGIRRMHEWAANSAITVSK